MTKTELDHRIALSGARTSKPMRLALEDVLIRSATWRDASIKRGVTESGILRALRRIGLR